MNTTYTVTTDSPSKISVESHLIYVLWMQGRAYAGFEAEFEVKTILVGDGSIVKVTCRTAKGKKLGKVEGATALNRYRGKVLIPESVGPDDYLYLEAELPKHGLKGESNLIPVRPPLEVTSMRWDKTKIYRDETAHLECTFVNGVEDGDRAMVLIFEYDPDGGHDLIVKIPVEISNGKVALDWKFEYQGETGSLSTEYELNAYQKNYRNPEYFFMVAVENIRVGNRQESGLLTFREKLHLQVSDAYGIIMKNEDFEVLFADGVTRNYTSDDKGFINDDSISPGKFFVAHVDKEE